MDAIWIILKLYILYIRSGGTYFEYTEPLNTNIGNILSAFDDLLTLYSRFTKNKQLAVFYLNFPLVLTKSKLAIISVTEMNERSLSWKGMKRMETTMNLPRPTLQTRVVVVTQPAWPPVAAIVIALYVYNLTPIGGYDPYRHRVSYVPIHELQGGSLSFVFAVLVYSRGINRIPVSHKQQSV